jgi:hypothetical protein
MIDQWFREHPKSKKKGNAAEHKLISIAAVW